MRLSTLALVLVSACGSSPAPSPTPGQAEPAAGVVILEGGRIWTGEGTRPGAVRIQDGVITHVFDRGPGRLERAERIDVDGATILPGLVDAHLHLHSIGRTARELDVRGTTSAEAVVERVREAVASAPPGSWIRGRGWDQNDWEVQEFPHRLALDAVAPDHPVWLRRVDGHAAWVNTAALRLTQIDADTPVPDGGEILRDEDGELTGVFIDNAADLIRSQLPQPTPEEIRADLLRALELCREVGLTGVHDMGTTPEVLEALRALEDEGDLTLRVWAYLDGSHEGLPPVMEAGVDREGLVQVVGVKLFADGALGSRGAWLLAPYSDRPETRGLLVTSEEELVARSREIHDRGFQVAIHAIGDAGVRNALDAIEAAQGDDRSRHHRIEHAQIVSEPDRPRFATLGITASMQPTHATSDMPWAEARLGAERIRGAYAWRTLLDAGALLAFGSDAPVEGHSPWWGVYAAITRTDVDGQPDGGWYPGERVDVGEAIAGFTSGPWRALGIEGGGMLSVGAAADLTVIDFDPTTVEAGALREARATQTWVAGRRVF